MLEIKSIKNDFNRKKRLIKQNKKILKKWEMQGIKFYIERRTTFEHAKQNETEIEEE